MEAPPDLDPVIGGRTPTELELAARERGVEVDAQLEPILRPRIAAHVTGSRQVLDVIEGELDRMIETLDIDPSASTRAAALWLLLGRSVGLQRAVLLLAESGMAVEAQPLDRTIKEMTNVIKAIAAAGPTAEKLARQWLTDGHGYVKAQAGRQGMTIPFKDVPGEEAAFTSLGVGSLSGADKRVYEYLSRAAHGRRSSTLESYYPATRHMARGANYALLEQIRAVDWASATTNGVVLAASVTFLPFYAQQYILETILPLSAALEAIRRDQLLEPEAVAAELGLGPYPFWLAQ